MNKIKAILAALIAVSLIGVVAAYDASNPFTCNMNWAIPTDTTFSIAFAGGETSVDFTCTAQTENEVEPDSQDDGASTPIIVVTNDGNIALNFSCNLTAAKPAWATITVSETNTIASGSTFDTTAVEFSDNVAASGTANMYIWTNVSSAAAGNTQRVLQINSYTS